MSNLHQSSTEKLVADIQTMTGSVWGEKQRAEIGDRIRLYRFEQVAAALVKVRELVKQSGNVELSEKIFMGMP